MCARRRSIFLLCRQKKDTKEKATPLDVSLRFAAGNLRCSIEGWHCRTRCDRFAHYAQTAAVSQSTKQGHLAVPLPTPRSALLGTARGVGSLSRAIAALGLGIERFRLRRNDEKEEQGACRSIWQRPPSLARSDHSVAEQSNGPSGYRTPLAVPRSTERGVGRSTARCSCFKL